MSAATGEGVKPVLERLWSHLRTPVAGEIRKRLSHLLECPQGRCYNRSYSIGICAERPSGAREGTGNRPGWRFRHASFFDCCRLLIASDRGECVRRTRQRIGIRCEACPSTGTGSGSGSGSSPDQPAPASAPDVSTRSKPEDMPTAVRMRRLEQQTQALKERAWQLKARVQMLKEQMLGGGVGAQALIAHANEMGSSFRLIKLMLHARRHAGVRRAPTRPATRSTRPRRSTSSRARSRRATTRSASSRPTAATATACSSTSRSTRSRARGNQSFIAGEGKISKVDCKGYEKGGATTPLEKRAGDRVQGHAGRRRSGRPSNGSAATPSPTPAPRHHAPHGEVSACVAHRRWLALALAVLAPPRSRARTSTGKLSVVRDRGAPARHRSAQARTSSPAAAGQRRLVDAEVAFTLGDYDTAALMLFDLASKPRRRAGDRDATTSASRSYQKGDRARRARTSRRSSQNAASKYYQPVARSGSSRSRSHRTTTPTSTSYLSALARPVAAGRLRPRQVRVLAGQVRRGARRCSATSRRARTYELPGPVLPRRRLRSRRRTSRARSKSSPI